MSKMNDYPGSAPKPLLKAQKLANLLDTSVKIPLINFRIGLDALVGLIPGVGDVLMLLVSFRIVQLGKQMGLPKGLIKVMVLTCLLDFGLGFIPLVGDIDDFFYKANQANVRIMEKYWVSNNKDAIDKRTQDALENWKSAQ
jgi:hypothetical protein